MKQKKCYETNSEYLDLKEFKITKQDFTLWPNNLLNLLNLLFGVYFKPQNTK